MTMITRCPVCETSFRITEAQLSTAKGAVRCGSCLQIFKAMDNLVPPRGAAKKAAEPAAETQGSAPRPKMPTFEYRKPAASFAPLSPEPRNDDELPKPASAAIEVDAVEPGFREELDSQEEREGGWQYGAGMGEVSDQDGQENMLRFDQTAIDASEDIPDDSVFADDVMISDDMSLANDDSDTSEKSSSNSIFDDDPNETFLDLDAWKTEEKSLFDRELKPRKQGDDDEDPVDPDESWAIDLLEEDDEPAPAPTQTSAHQQRDFKAEVSEQEPFDDSDAAAQDDYGSYSRARTGSFGALDDEEVDMFGDAGSAHDDSSSKAAHNESDEEYGDDYDYLDAGDDYVDDSDRHALLSRIEPEPVEFAFYQDRSWRKKLAWGGAAVLGLLLLLAQLAWLQFDSLSRQQPYRDLYARVCPVLGCELPSLAAPHMIRTSNLVVRSHPQAAGALMVDTILLNTASFQQPFPDLVLSFSNIHGEMLATRRFTPGEYLSGELAGRTTMPSNQPVHLSLEIVDPGPDAINYSAFIPQ